MEAIKENKMVDVRCEVLNKTEEAADLYLYGRIVDEQPIDWWTGEKVQGDFIYPENVRELVKELGDRKINIHLNSTGGNIYASIAISNYLKQIDNEVNIYIDGTAGSGASIIAMAGDKIYMPINTTMMIHRAAVGVYGNAEELRKAAEVLDKFDETVLNSYKSRFVGTTEELKELIAEETYLTAEECKTLGLCDELLYGADSDKYIENHKDLKVSLLEKYKINNAESHKEDEAAPKGIFKNFRRNE